MFCRNVGILKRMWKMLGSSGVLFLVDILPIKYVCNYKKCG